MPLSIYLLLDNVTAISVLSEISIMSDCRYVLEESKEFDITQIMVPDIVHSVINNVNINAIDRQQVRTSVRNNLYNDRESRECLLDFSLITCLFLKLTPQRLSMACVKLNIMKNCRMKKLSRMMKTIIKLLFVSES